MIIYEENHPKERREELKKIWGILRKVKLPKRYYFKKCLSGFEIHYSRFIIYEELVGVVERVGNENIIEVSIFEEKDFEKLRDCLESSPINFKVFVGRRIY